MESIPAPQSGFHVSVPSSNSTITSFRPIVLVPPYTGSVMSHGVLAAHAMAFQWIPSFDGRIETASVAGVDTPTTALLVAAAPPSISMVSATGGLAAAAAG